MRHNEKISDEWQLKYQKILTERNESYKAHQDLTYIARQKEDLESETREVAGERDEAIKAVREMERRVVATEQDHARQLLAVQARLTGEMERRIEMMSNSHLLEIDRQKVGL